MNIEQRIAALKTHRDQLQQQGLDLSLAAEKAGRSMSDVEIKTLAGWREQAQAISREIEELLPLAEAARAHAEGIAALTADPQSQSGGDPAGGGVRPSSGPPVSAGPALTRVNEKLPWSNAGEFMRDYVGSMPNPLNGGMVDTRMAERINKYMETRATEKQTTGETPGLLPEPIIGQIMNDVDEARPFIASIGAKPLSNVAGKQFSRPHVTQHTAAGAQVGELTALPSQKLKVEPVDFVKTTMGGSLQVSRQDIDWTDPAAWQAILDDMAAIYSEATDDVAAADLATKVTQTVAAASNELDGIIDALYAAAYKVLTKDGTQRARALRLPDVVWTSADMWAKVGAAIDKSRKQVNPDGTGLGTGGVGTVNGSILDLPRIMVPGLPAGTAIVGAKRWTEFYEQRIGLLSAVQPSVLGLEIAVPGYVAYGTIDPTCFCEVTAAPVTP